MAKTTAIMICAGEGTRWGNYLGVPKHLIEIEGETIVSRAVRLLKNYDCDIYVVGRGDDNRYKIPGSTYYEAKLNSENGDADKFLSSKDLWNKEGRTIVFWGDCYFTESAINKIMTYPIREWTLFARFGSSMYTGCVWGECFAQSFYSGDIEKHGTHLNKLVSLYKSGELPRCGGWEHYRSIVGIENLNSHEHRGNFVDIDDFTDDFDFPEDYDRWKKNYENYIPCL